MDGDDDWRVGGEFVGDVEEHSGAGRVCAKVGNLGELGGVGKGGQGQEARGEGWELHLDGRGGMSLDGNGSWGCTSSTNTGKRTEVDMVYYTCLTALTAAGNQVRGSRRRAIEELGSIRPHPPRWTP